MFRSSIILLIWYSALFGSLQICAQPRLVVPVGHADYVYKVIFSPDSRYVASISGDNTVKVWLANDGTLLQTLTGHKSYISDCEFSRDGKYIATFSITDTSAKVWEVSTGKVVLNTGRRDGLYPDKFFISPSGKYVANTFKGEIDVIDLQTRETAIKLNRKPGRSWVNPYNYVAFNPDDRFLIAGSSIFSDSVFAFDLHTGMMFRSFKAHGINLKRISISPDSKYIAVYNEDSLSIIDFATGRDIYITKINIEKSVPEFSGDGKFLFGLAYDSSGSVAFKRFELATGRENITRYPIQTTKYFRGTISPDGSQLRILTDRGLVVSALQFGKNNPLFSIPLSQEAIYAVLSFMDPYRTNFSPDGKWVALFAYINTAAVFDMTGRLRYDLKGSIQFDSLLTYEQNRNFVYAPQNTYFSSNLVAGDLSNTMDNIHISKPTNKGLTAQPLEFFEDSLVNQWYTELGGRRILFDHYKGSKPAAAWLSPGSRYIVTTGDEDSVALIWNAGTGEKMHAIGSGFKFKSDRVKFNTQGTAVAISEVKKRWGKDLEDFRHLPYHILIADLQTGKTIFEKSDVAEDYYYPFARAEFIDSSSHFLEIASRMVIWDTRDWKKIFEIPNPHSLYWGNATCSHNNKILLCFSNTASVYEAYSNKLLYILPGEFSYARFSDDDKYILTQSPDNLVKVWDTSIGELLYTYFAFEDNNYLVMDKYGRYDGTEKARKKLYYVCGDEVIGLDQFKELCWQPQLAAKIMGRDPQPIIAKKISEIDICGQTPLINNSILKDGSYEYRITPRTGGLGELQLFLQVDGNEKLLRRIDPSTLLKKGNDYILTVPQKEFNDYLVAGSANELKVRATNKDRTMTSRGGAMALNNAKKNIPTPNIYLLSIGISQYKGNELRLFYASKDARDFASALSLSAKKLLNTDGREHVSSFTFNTEPGNPNWPLKQAIAKTIDSIAKLAKAEDILVIFFAGHGALKSDKKELYLLTAEASAFELGGVEKEVAISFNELKNWMQKIKANKQLVILDACYSGMAVENLSALAKKRSIPDDQARALEDLKDITGTYVLSASSAEQSGFESSLYNQGILTYCLLSGIKLGEGLKDNKYIDVTKWFNAAANNVKLMARELGKSQDPRLLGNASFNVGLVDKEVLDGIKLSVLKNVFKRSNFVKEGLIPSDNQLGLSLAVDKLLNEVSVSGNESLMTFIPDNRLPDAYSIVGNYQVTGNHINVKVYVLKGDKEDEPLQQFSLTGQVDKKEELAQQIVDEVKKYIGSIK
ncbi:MAG TPA: caspase family protein [Chitinophagaceae bacterium]|nr:caspase family protein [Chitinophagaceae bacterium]